MVNRKKRGRASHWPLRFRFVIDMLTARWLSSTSSGILRVCHNLQLLQTHIYMIKFILCVCLPVMASMVAFATDQSDANAIQGSWTLVKAELGGQPMSED